MEAPKVYAAILAVAGDLSKEGISKDRVNEQQRFKFRGIDDVLNALSTPLVKHGLVILPEVLNREQIERATKTGGAIFYTALTVKFTLACAADGSCVSVVTCGEAMDSADKGSNKAMSAAYKYMALQVFCIPTEADNDADAHSPPETTPVNRVVNLAFDKPKIASDAGQKKKPQTVAEYLTELETQLQLASTHSKDAVDSVASTPRALTALRTLTGPSLDRMKGLIADAYARVLTTT